MKKNHFVSVYEVISAYGGSEEGGWYYEAFFLTASYEAHHFKNLNRSYKRAERMAKQLAKENPGHHFRIVVESDMGKLEKLEKPVYC